MIRLKLVIFFFIILSLNAIGQVKTIGTPYIHNYTKSEYEAGTQNWGIGQDENQFMYFANNDGILQFDGLHWNLIEVSQSSPVRSVLVTGDNKILVGLFNDFGVLQRNETNQLTFESLRHLLPDTIVDFNDVWKIYETPQGVVFQSYDYLFILKNNKIEVLQPQNTFQFSFFVNNRLFLQEPGIGLFELRNRKLVKLSWADELAATEIWSVMEYSDGGLLIGTARNGLFKYEDEILEKWNTPANKLVESFKLFSAIKIDDGHFVFGTITNGIVIADSAGNVVQHINRDHGLQNNTILSLFSDSNKNLWLGLDNGVDYVEINSPISFISKYGGLGTGYTSLIFNNNLYIGTNQGLFVKPFEGSSSLNEKFELVENTTGQVWSLGVFNNEVICGHNVGTFKVDGKNAKLISTEEGAWEYISLTNKSDLLLGGHYNGLALLEKTDTGWNFFKKVKGFNESSRYLLEDSEGFVWMSHASKGIFRIELNNSKDSVVNYQVYNSQHGLPSDEQNILFILNGRKYASTINGVYDFNVDSETFEYSEELNQIFGEEGRLKFVQTDDEENIWFITETESGVLRVNEDLTYTKITSPFKELEGKFVDEFEFVYPYNSEHVFFGIDNGFAHYSSEFPKSYNEPFQSYITKVELPYIDSVLHLTGNHDSEFEYPFQKNFFRFHFTAPFYENQDKLKFSYYLENYDERWSEWSTLSFKDFTNLPEGDYTFRLKAKNVFGVESEASSFSFVVTPPWFRSLYAYYSYVLLFAALVYLLFRLFLYRMSIIRRMEMRKHRAELREKEERFQHQAVVAEKEIIKLRNEKLKDEMVFRDKELANQTMGIIQKNKFLVKLRDELQRVQKASDNEKLKKKLSNLNRSIDKEIDNKQQNQLFETYFDEVHDEFFTRLKEHFPQISPREMRLCAYIRMNLTSKEIATLLNITDRGVEISRYRLRKKLNLPRETNLSTFLSNI